MIASRRGDPSCPARFSAPGSRLRRRLTGNLACLLAACSLLALSCRESVVGPVDDGAPDIKGFSYTSFAENGFTQGGERDAVGDLKSQINNTWIALTVFEYQTDPTSSDIAPNTTGTNPLTAGPWPTSSTEEDLLEGVREARAAQMKIMLKPQIDLYTGEWRAAIRPGLDGQWFSTYTAMMVKYARIAQTLHIDMLCIGTEYVVATQGTYTPQWKALIAMIRHYYFGKLVYAANWSGAGGYGVPRPEYEQITFWKDLDVIGVDVYYPLTRTRDDSTPSFEAAVPQVRSWAEGIGALAAVNDRPVVITEIGIQSVRGALAAPWDYALGSAADARPDTAIQEFYYRVMIHGLGELPWCAGMFWWNWESVPSPNAPTNYTPRNKPAAATVRAWYSGQAAVAAR